MTTLSMFPPTPLLYLVCQNCGGDMIRFVAYGLNIYGDKTQAEVVHFNQDCSVCGHSHEPGALLKVKIYAKSADEVGLK